MTILSLIKSLRHRLMIFIYRLLPIKKNKIFCMANNLKSYACNPKYISEYIVENYPGEYDIVWGFNESAVIDEEIPEQIRAVRYFSPEFLRELHTAKFIISNTRLSEALMFHKRKGQYYIQTWHSSIRLKKIEGDADLPQSYIETAKADSANIDLVISGCDFSTRIFENSFWYSGEILKCGTPRCDMLVNRSAFNDNIVRQSLGIGVDKRILLYAPTFRKDYKANDLGLDYALLKAALEKSFGGDWVIAYRYHPNVTVTADTPRTEWLKSATDYNDMQQLLCAADMLITDYSSCMFDMAIAGKPCLLFTPDLESYMADERGLYFDIKSLPFGCAKTNDELCRLIEQFDKQQYSNEICEFMKSIGSYETGGAAKAVTERIRQLTK